MKAYRYHNLNGEKLEENGNWKIEKHHIEEHNVSPQLWEVLMANPNVPTYMKSYCDKDFRDKHPDVNYFPPKQ